MQSEALSQTRESLINRLKNWEDQESWKQFFDNYWRFIFGAARKSGLSEQEAQEVVQETVITVAKNIHQFKKDPNRGCFKSWLMNTTRWRILDQFRKRKRADMLVHHALNGANRTDVLERVPDPSHQDLENNWRKEWEDNLLEAALERVRKRVEPDRYQLFDLHVLKNWPAQKVAATLDIPISQVYSAKNKVKEVLEQQIHFLKKAIE